MAGRKITYNPKTRNDISNPFNKLSHEDLLKLSGVEIFHGKVVIEHLPNGRIRAVKGPNRNNYKSK